MFKKIMLAALATGALAFNAPAAMAGPEGPDGVGCRFNATHQESVTGQNFEGVAYGYVAHAGDDDISIRCYITVNGAEASTTVTGTGDNFATTSGRITYSALQTDVVEICYDITTDHGFAKGCVGTTRTQIPPQAVIDAINSVLEQVDPTICPVIAQAKGVYGPIEIGADGDVSINGGLWYDCPPYVVGG